MNTNKSEQSSQEEAPVRIDAQEHSETFQNVPHHSSHSSSQQPEPKELTKKRRPDSLEQNISEQQRSRLFAWLADHSYTEVQEIVALEPPEGFGMAVSKTTLCRFYKAHYVEIDRIRQDHLDERAAETLRINIGGDYLAGLQDSTRQLLMERYFEMLSRPVESIDELKKLVMIADKLKAFHVDGETSGEQAANKLIAFQLARAAAAVNNSKADNQSGPPPA